jgi:hypothetical protein
LLFVFLVPLGTLLLSAGLVTLLLPISKGSTRGCADRTTLALFATSLAVFTVFAMWQFRTPSPTVDLRTTLKRPVLTTNLASIGVGFALFAISLIGPADSGVAEADHIDGLSQVVARWNPEDVSALVTQVDKFVDAIDLASTTGGNGLVTGPIRQQIRG